MNGSHARPMTAYAALCAAAVVVLAQSTGPSAPVAEAVAQAGRPVTLLAAPVTMAMADQLGDGLRDVSASITSSLVPAVASAQHQAARMTGHAAAPTTARRAATTTQVADPVTIAPATSGAGSTSPSRVAQRTTVDRKADHKADRAAARDARKAHRSAAKDTRKAHHRAARHGR